MGNPNWKKGVSGNPAGRPPKARALTEILTKAGAKTVDVDGKHVSGRLLLARMVWQIATTGQTTMPDGKVLILDPEDWMGLVKWIYQHIDGPPKAELDVTSAGKRIKGYIGFTPDEWPGDDDETE